MTHDQKSGAMTTKERWTVYPLLLLAIGLAVRGDLVDGPAERADTVTANAVVCRELAIVGDAVEPGGSPPIVVHAGRVKGGGGGRIEIRDAAGIDSVAIGTTADSREGSVEFFGEESQFLGRLGPVPPRSDPPAAEQE